MIRKAKKTSSLAAGLILLANGALADEIKVEISKISADGIGPPIGTLTLRDNPDGMTVIPDLRDLPPGNHAFHVHENPSCEAGMKDGKKIAGLAAGGHFDPTGTGHRGSHHQGHGGHSKPHGDLPELKADANGTATTQVSTDKLKVKQVRGRSIMIHRYGDNDPGKPRGGGPRYACGVIPD